MILVADSTKIGRSSLTRLGALDLIQTFVTDSGIVDSDATAFRRHGIEVLIAMTRRSEAALRPNGDGRPFRKAAKASSVIATSCSDAG